MTKRQQPDIMTKRKKKVNEKHNRKPKKQISKKSRTKSIGKRRGNTSKKTNERSVKKRSKNISRSKLVAKTSLSNKKGNTITRRRNKATKSKTARSKIKTTGRKRINTVQPVQNKSNKKVPTGRTERRGKPFTVHKRFRVGKDGKRIKHIIKTYTGNEYSIGYKEYYHINLSTYNTFAQKVAAIRQNDFAFLKEPLNRHRPSKGYGAKEPRAVVINLMVSYRGKTYWLPKSTISDFSFIVNIPNVKQLILDRMIEYQDNYLERMEDNDDYLEGSGKTYQPKNIKMVSLNFIY